jgi:hypothetical protein
MGGKRELMASQAKNSGTSIVLVPGYTEFYCVGNKQWPACGRHIFTGFQTGSVTGPCFLSSLILLAEDRCSLCRFIQQSSVSIGL